MKNDANEQEQNRTWIDQIKTYGQTHPWFRFTISFVFGLASSVPLFSLLQNHIISILEKNAASVLGVAADSLSSQAWIRVLLIVAFSSLMIMYTLYNYFGLFQKNNASPKTHEQPDNVGKNEDVAKKNQPSFWMRPAKVLGLFNGIVTNLLIAIYFTYFAFLSFGSFTHLPSFLPFSITFGVLMGAGLILNSTGFTASAFVDFLKNKDSIPETSTIFSRARRTIIYSFSFLLALSFASMDSLSMANHVGMIPAVLLIGLPTLLVVPFFLLNFIYKSSANTEDTIKKENNLMRDASVSSIIFLSVGLVSALVSSALPYALSAGILFSVIKNIYFCYRQNKSDGEKNSSVALFTLKKLALAVINAVAVFMISLTFGLGFVGFVAEHISTTHTAFIAAMGLSAIMMGIMQAFFSNVYNRVLVLYEDGSDTQARRMRPNEDGNMSDASQPLDFEKRNYFKISVFVFIVLAAVLAEMAAPPFVFYATMGIIASGLLSLFAFSSLEIELEPLGDIGMILPPVVPYDQPKSTPRLEGTSPVSVSVAVENV
jgi:hypothetical protein